MIVLSWMSIGLPPASVASTLVGAWILCAMVPLVSLCDPDKVAGCVPPRSRIATVLSTSFMKRKGDTDWFVAFATRWFGIIVAVVTRSPSQRGFVVQAQRWKIERTFGLVRVEPHPEQRIRTYHRSERERHLSCFHSTYVTKVDLLAQVRNFIYTASIHSIACKESHIARPSVSA